MAQPTTAKPGKMVIKIDGNAPCGLTSKNLTITKNLAEVAIPDCDDPDAPFWMERDVESMSAAITGDGVLAAEAEDVWNDAMYSTDPVDATVSIEFTTGIRTFSGKWHMNTYQMAAQQGQKVTANISMLSAGQITSTFV